MPLPGAPLVATESTLLARARQGDRAAAIRLTSELQQCSQAADFARSFGNYTLDRWMAERVFANNQTPESLAAIRAAVAHNMDYVEQRKTLCTGMQGKSENATIFEAWWMAARLGDDNATACLLSPNRELPANSSAADREAYDREAMQLSERGLANGNWHVVQALSYVYSYSGVEGQTGPVSHIDWPQRLRMDWLQRLSYPDGSADAKERDSSISLLRERMTPEEASAAEQDARAMFERSFRNVAPVPVNQIACVAPGME